MGMDVVLPIVALAAFAMGVVLIWVLRPRNDYKQRQAALKWAFEQTGPNGAPEHMATAAQYLDFLKGKTSWAWPERGTEQ